MNELPPLKFDTRRCRVKFCPCGKSNNDLKFVPYVGYDNKGYCHSCGETFLPEISKGLDCNQSSFPITTDFINRKIGKIPVDFLPFEIMDKSLDHWAGNDFTKWLISLFGFETTKNICKVFHVGSSRHWQHSTMFWQVDIKGNLRNCKIMLYSPINGKRIKSGSSVFKWNYYNANFIEENTKIDCVKVYGKWLNYETQKLKNLYQCFFGEHQMNEFSEKKIGIVESEKTAIISTLIFPEFIWLATGGKNGCKWTEYDVCKVLENRQIVLFPDKGKDCFDLWQRKAIEIKSKVKCEIYVSNFLENIEGLKDGSDLVDYFESTGEIKKKISNQTN